MSAWDDVIAKPASIVARRRLAQEWRAGGDPRAELLERELEQHDGPPIATLFKDAKAIRKLKEEHGREWAGAIADRVDGFRYEIGLVASIGVTGNKFVEEGEELVRLAPIVHLAVKAPMELGAVSHTRAFAQIRTLSVRGGEWVNDEAIEYFVTGPYVGNLRAIHLRNGAIGQRGLAALYRLPNLANMIYIDLTGNPCADQCTKVMDSSYIVGKAGQPHLDEAYREATQSYDPGGIHFWPPLPEKFTYEE